MGLNENERKKIRVWNHVPILPSLEMGLNENIETLYQAGVIVPILPSLEMGLNVERIFLYAITIIGSNPAFTGNGSKWLRTSA